MASISALVCVFGSGSGSGCTFSTNTMGTGGGDDVSPMVDASVPLDTTPQDIDGDGVANAADNCPMIANMGQYNEDGDATGDPCDPCPQLAAAADDMDGDEDGIGNGCDPRPTTAGDVLAYWNGFHVASSGLPAEMAMIHGSATRWSVAGGFLVFDPNTSDWGMPVVNVGKVNHTTDTTFEIVNVFVGAAAAGVAVDAPSNDNDVFECQMRNDTNRRELWRRDPQDLDGWVALQGVDEASPAGTYRITLQRTPTALACTTTLAGQPSVPVAATTASLQNTRAGLFARNMDVRFRYVAIYTVP